MRSVSRMRATVEPIVPSVNETCHRPAAHLLQLGAHMRTVQESLGRADVATAMIHMRVLKRGNPGARRPVDGLALG